MMPTKARLNLEISLGTRDRMHRLKKNLDLASLTEVVRLALRVLERVAEHDGEFVMRHPDGREVAIELFLPKGTD